MNSNFKNFLEEHGIKAFIFDMDGTLLDSMKEWFTISRNFLLEKGKEPAPDLEQHLKSVEGKNVADYLIEAYQLDATPNEFNDYVVAHVAKQYETRVSCKPFAKEFLNQAQAAGIPFCVCTMSHHDIAESAFRRLGILEQLEFIMTAADVNGKRKDCPDIYLEAARRMGVDDPAHCMVFEDTFLCVDTAHSAGFPVVGVYDPAAAMYEEQMKELCDFYIHSFEELV